MIDPDQLLENALSRTDRSPEELDPFWAATWRAAIGLDRYLARQPIQGQRVLELGCGSGRAGIAAALHGAVVTMTDAAVEGMWVAEYNAFPVRQATESSDFIGVTRHSMKIHSRGSLDRTSSTIPSSGRYSNLAFVAT